MIACQRCCGSGGRRVCTSSAEGLPASPPCQPPDFPMEVPTSPPLLPPHPSQRQAHSWPLAWGRAYAPCALESVATVWLRDHPGRWHRTPGWPVSCQSACRGWQVGGRTALSSPVSRSGLAGLACPQNCSCREAQAARHSRCSGTADLSATSGWKEDPGTAASCWHGASVPSAQCPPSSGLCTWRLATLRSPAAPGTSSPPASPSRACRGLSAARPQRGRGPASSGARASPSLRGDTGGPAS